MTDRTMIALLQCQLQGAEERASTWENIAASERREVERLQEIINDLCHPIQDGWETRGPWRETFA